MPKTLKICPKCNKLPNLVTLIASYNLWASWNLFRHKNQNSKSGSNGVMFLKIWANPGLFSFIFVPFTSQINYKLKKRWWSAWDSNPGPQDGRRRRNHGAMAATHRWNVRPHNYQLNSSWFCHQISDLVPIYPCLIQLTVGSYCPQQCDQ